MNLVSRNALLLGLSVVSARAAISATGLEAHYTFGSGSVSGTMVTDQWTGDGNADNVGRSSLTSILTGARFGHALNVSSSAGTPRALTSEAAMINESFLPGTGNYTLTFWFRQGAAGFNRIFGAGARGNNANNNVGLQIYMLGSNGHEVAVHDPAAAANSRLTFNTSNAGVFDGATWNHFALVRDGTDLRLWLSGPAIGSGTLPTGYSISVGSGTFRREPGLGPDGTVTGAAYDDAAIFKRALSGSEISQIWKGGAGASIGALVPEPSSAGVGALIMVALLRRRR